jgi:hypothetical protein
MSSLLEPSGTYSVSAHHAISRPASQPPLQARAMITIGQGGTIISHIHRIIFAGCCQLTRSSRIGSYCTAGGKMDHNSPASGSAVPALGRGVDVLVPPHSTLCTRILTDALSVLASRIRSKARRATGSAGVTLVAPTECKQLSGAQGSWAQEQLLCKACVLHVKLHGSRQP